MNVQQIPGPKGEHGVFQTINGKEMRWTDKIGLTHVVVGADVHPDTRLLWTLCERDLPADKAWLRPDGWGGAYELCMICLKRMNDQKAVAPAGQN